MPDINVLWYSTRGSAIVSQIMFTAVAMLGVLTAVRWHSPRWPPSSPRACTAASRCRHSCSSASTS